MSQGLKAQELESRFQGSLLHCPPNRMFTEVQALDDAQSSAISFFANPRYREAALASKAGMILCGLDDDLGDQPQLKVKNPYLVFAQCIASLHPEAESDWRSVSSSSSAVDQTAEIAPGVRLAPGISIGQRVRIASGCVIYPGVHIGDDCIIGPETILYSGVVLYRRTQVGARVRIHANTVVGSDGYGYVLHEGRHHKIPQVGFVILGDDVELGSGVTIDRGVLGATMIGDGTKIDNQVQIGHNVQVGKHCLLVSQTGISGSTTLEDYVTLAGKVGVVGHITIGEKSIVGGNSVVTKNIPAGSFVTGYPAQPHQDWLAEQVLLRRLRKQS